MIVFNQRKYYFDKTTGYYRAHIRAANRDYLHRDVWRFYNGPIPPGHEVHHHVDDRGTVNPADLELVSFDEHLDRHADARRHNGLVTRNLVTPVGSFTCAGCAVEYRAHTKRRNRWCSKACANRYWNAHYSKEGKPGG